MVARPLLAVLVALAAFTLQGHLDCRAAAACGVAAMSSEVKA